jgi:hypothetical protein
VREEQIEQDQVGTLPYRDLERLPSVRGSNHAIALVLEIEREGRSGLVIVLDDEDERGASHREMLARNL